MKYREKVKIRIYKNENDKSIKFIKQKKYT